MKKIGRGWQYTTYDLGNSRVLKKYNSVVIGYIHMMKECFPFVKHPLWKLPSYYRGCKETARDSIKKISNPVLEEWIMGNPKILNELDYEQDKVTPLHDFFKTCTVEKGKRTIDTFVDFSKMLVEKKQIDKSFNIAKNFALDSKGRIVFMDLGEIFSSDMSIQRQIERKAWAAHYVVNSLPEGFREYFVNSMNRAFI